MSPLQNDWPIDAIADAVADATLEGIRRRQNNPGNVAAIADEAAAAAVEAVRRQRRRSDEMDPPPPYDEALNSAILSGAQDGSPSSQSTPPPPRYSLHHPRSPPRQTDATSRTRCPQVPQSTGSPPQEDSGTTRQRDIRRQNVERLIPDTFRESEESQPRVDATSPITDYWQGSVGRLTVAPVGRTRDDYRSEAALFRRRTMEEQLLERIETLEKIAGTQRRTITTLHRKVEDRDMIIQEKNYRLQNMSSRWRETEALLQKERKRSRAWF